MLLHYECVCVCVTMDNRAKNTTSSPPHYRVKAAADGGKASSPAPPPHSTVVLHDLPTIVAGVYVRNVLITVVVPVCVRRGAAQYDIGSQFSAVMVDDVLKLQMSLYLLYFSHQFPNEF